MTDVAPYSLPDLLSDALRGLEPSLAPKRVSLVRQIDRTTPSITLDPSLLAPVVETLLREAAAATTAGGRIRVCLKHSRAAIMLAIKDQSAAPPPGEIAARIEDASRAPAPGAPMNLSAVKAAVAALGGNFFANGAEKLGTTYYVTLPSSAAGPAGGGSDGAKR